MKTQKTSVEDFTPTEQEQRTACLLMLSSGLSVEDCSRVLEVSAEVVKGWMNPRESESSDET